jgi:hypothetical protein
MLRHQCYTTDGSEPPLAFTLYSGPIKEAGKLRVAFFVKETSRGTAAFEL